MFLVEDQALLRESLSAMLGLDPDIEMVGQATDAESALRELKSLAVDVVLMYIRLSGMSSIEVTRRLKEMRQDVAVVMFTSYGNEYVHEAVSAGTVGYIGLHS